MRRDGDFPRSGMTRSLAATVAAALGTLALLAGAVAILPAPGPLGLFALAFLIFTAPGWGLARFYAGRDLDRVAHTVLALFFGLLAGSLVFCVMRLLHVTGPLPVLAACGLTGALTWWSSRDVVEGVVPLPRLGPADHAAMGGLALLVGLVVAPVFVNVGRIDQGDLAYRAYFFADLFAHMSVVGELEKQTIPTVNPYLNTEALPYYWTYFTFPTVFSMLQPSLHVDRGLLLMAFTGAALYTMVWYCVARALGGSPLASGVSWATVIAATSYEGIALIGYLWQRGAPFRQIRDYNVDALTRWWWEAPSADGLHRLFWYTPQHGTAITAGLLAVATYVLARDANGIRRALFDGFLLGGALMCSSFNGGMLVIWYAAAEITALIRARGGELGRWILARGTAAVCVIVGFGLLVGLGMIQHSANVAVIRWNTRLLNEPVWLALMTLGTAPLVAVVGVRRMWRQASKAFVAFAVLAAICLLILSVVELKYHPNTYVPFRAFHMLYLVCAVWMAFAVDTWQGWRRPARLATWAAVAILVALALPTVALDWYNTRDIRNVDLNPGGFAWTVRIGPGDQAALRWIRRNLPTDATVQTDAETRGRATWALIPALARRRLVTGLGLFEPDQTRFEPNMRRIRTLFATADIEEAYGYCQRLGIDYLYVGDVERAAYGEGAEKFARHPTRFKRVFGNAAVQIYEVLEGP
jgi:hypothetical protein